MREKESNFPSKSVSEIFAEITDPNGWTPELIEATRKMLEEAEESHLEWAVNSDRLPVFIRQQRQKELDELRRKKSS